MTKAEILALQPGREFDALVAEKVMGLKREVRLRGEANTVTAYKSLVDGLHTRDEVLRYGSPLPYSTDIAAAWQVVEAMRPEYGFWIDGDDGYIVEFQHGMPGMTDYRHGRAFAPTAPEAICKAALLAKLESGEV